MDNYHPSFLLKKGDKMINYKYKVGDIDGKHIVLDRFYIKDRYEKCYLIKCKDCGYEFKLSEKRMNKNDSCACCSNKKIIKGINDIATTHPQYVKYFKNKEDSFSCSIGSSANRITFICPTCNSETILRPKEFIGNGCHCKYCGNSGSFPERFINAFLKKLNINYFQQKIFDWSERKRYDFFIPSLNCIIEAHGLQHYAENSLTSRTLEYEIKNDEYKRNLAILNGVKTYIQLDCSKSSIEFIRNSILNSELSRIFNLSSFDFNECIFDSNKEEIVKVCKYYKENNTSSRKMESIFNIHRYRIVEYLKIGNNLGLCKYDKEEIEKSRKNFAKESLILRNSNKNIICINDKKIFNTYSECAKYYGCHRISISKCCKRKNHYVINNNMEKLFFLFEEDYCKMSKKEIKELVNFKQKSGNKTASELNKISIIDLSTMNVFDSKGDYIKESGISSYLLNKKIERKEVMIYKEYLKEGGRFLVE